MKHDNGVVVPRADRNSVSRFDLQVRNVGFGEEGVGAAHRESPLLRLLFGMCLTIREDWNPRKPGVAETHPKEESVNQKRVLGVLVIILLAAMFLVRKYDIAEPPPAAPLLAPQHDSIVGQCAFNPSDDRFLGRVVRVAPANEVGQSTATIALAKELRDRGGGAMTDITYPRYLKVTRCERSVD